MPVQQLKGFERIQLSPGERRTVSFELDAAKELALVNKQWQWVVEPGRFNVMVGPSSHPAGRLNGHFTVEP